MGYGIEVDFHLVISTNRLALLSGTGDLRGVGIKYLNGMLYVCGDDTAVGGLLAAYAYAVVDDEHAGLENELAVGLSE